VKNIGTLKVTAPTDREVALRRVFDAPRHLVFEAFSNPDMRSRLRDGGGHVVEQATGEHLNGTPLDDPNGGKKRHAMALARISHWCSGAMA
jgi:hypothetical protein